MQATNSDKENSKHNSRKKLVRILVIVGIGIPVLIELMTLFNLINVQIFENDKEIDWQSESVTEVQQFVEGDTLFADQSLPLIIDEMKIKVSAQEWRFALKLTSRDTTIPLKQEVKVDSLELKSGNILTIRNTYSWKSRKGKSYISDEWELPSGDIPVVLYLSSEQPVRGDSIRFYHQKARLGNIPVRYTRE